MALRQLAQRREMGPAGFGGIVIRPTTVTGQRSRKAGSSSGEMPLLPGSPAAFTSIITCVSGVAWRSS
jgi:hypothetical protein